ncbi:MAG: VOC family protein [Acidimicrobiales bacterium]
MSTEGIIGFFVGCRDYEATAALWGSLGFVNRFETDHGSGQWVHPTGGPYVLIAEQDDPDVALRTHPILGVADCTDFHPDPAPMYVRSFVPEHWGVAEAVIADPDGREISLQAPVPHGAAVPDIDEHHRTEHG